MGGLCTPKRLQFPLEHGSTFHLVLCLVLSSEPGTYLVAVAGDSPDSRIGPRASRANGCGDFAVMISTVSLFLSW